jgi:hypothetical protein
VIARLPLSQTKPQDKNDENEDATKVPENRTRIDTTLPTLIIWRKKIPQTLRSNHFLLQTKITKKEQNRTETYSFGALNLVRNTILSHFRDPAAFRPSSFFFSLSLSTSLYLEHHRSGAPNSSLEKCILQRRRRARNGQRSKQKMDLQKSQESVWMT